MTMIWSGYEADQRLAGMDLSVEDFRHAAEAAHATYVSRSPNDAENRSTRLSSSPG